MQNDQKNYWQNDEKSDEVLDSYQPSPDEDNKQEINHDDKQSPDDSVNNISVHWSASEYISQEKDWIWYVFFGLIVAAFIAIDIFLLKEFTFSILVVVMAFAVVVFSKRPPRTVNYTLTGNQGLYIDEKLYHFNDFRAFGILKDHGQHTIMLIPTKRFSPSVSVYFPEEVGEKIVDILGNRLPMEQVKLDIIDIIVQKIRL